jgi:hypothetical protein
MGARGTVPCVVDALRSCLQAAVDDGLSAVNPASRLGALTGKGGKAVLSEREGLAYVRDQLGHASIKITVDTEGQLVPGANKPAVDRLDELTGRNLYATAMKHRGTAQPRKGMSMADKQVTVYSNVG